VWLICPYLGAEVEFTLERVQHDGRRHGNVDVAAIALALQDPDRVVLRPWIRNQVLFVRSIDEPSQDRHIVVVVVRDEPRTDIESPRQWVITAYLARALPVGIVEWERN
jgi:hypothetical protein